MRSPSRSLSSCLTWKAFTGIVRQLYCWIIHKSSKSPKILYFASRALSTAFFSQFGLAFYINQGYNSTIFVGSCISSSKSSSVKKSWKQRWWWYGNVTVMLTDDNTSGTLMWMWIIIVLTTTVFTQKTMLLPCIKTMLLLTKFKNKDLPWLLRFMRELTVWPGTFLIWIVFVCGFYSHWDCLFFWCFAPFSIETPEACGSGSVRACSLGCERIQERIQEKHKKAWAGVKHWVLVECCNWELWCVRSCFFFLGLAFWDCRQACVRFEADICWSHTNGLDI